MSHEQKPGDPADKGLDTFQPTTNHRAGYGDDRLARLIAWLRDHPTTTLASGEGALLLGEIDRLRDDLHTQDGWVQWAKGEINALRRANKDSMDHYTDARAEVDRLRDQLYLADQSARSSSAEAARLGRILAALRAAVERVRALHTPISYPEGDFPNDKWCAHCEMIHGSVYWGDNDPTRWPCPTLRALEETP